MATLSQANFNPSEQSSDFLSDASSLMINAPANQVSLVPAKSSYCYTPGKYGYKSAPDSSFYLGVNYKQNYVAVTLPYISPVNNRITGANIPLQTPFGSKGWSGTDATIKLVVAEDFNGAPNFSRILANVQASMSPILSSNGIYLVGTGQPATLNFSFSSPISVNAGQKVHFVLTPGANWPVITTETTGYCLVWPYYDPTNVNTTFGYLSSQPVNSSIWKKSTHGASFAVLLETPIYSTTSPFIAYVFDAGKSVTWDFSSFTSVENPNGELGNVTYSVLITNATSSYFNTSSVCFINNVNLAKLKTSAKAVGRTLILQVHLNSPDGLKSASAGPASINYF
jgi:hypothetical protein